MAAAAPAYCRRQTGPPGQKPASQASRVPLSCGLRTFGLRLGGVVGDEIGADYSGQPFNCNPSLPAAFFHEYGSLCGPTCGPARGWLSLQLDCAVTQIDSAQAARD